MRILYIHYYISLSHITYVIKQYNNLNPSISDFHISDWHISEWHIFSSKYCVSGECNTGHSDITIGHNTLPSYNDTIITPRHAMYREF